MILLKYQDNILTNKNQHIFLLINILVQDMKDNFLRLIHNMLNTMNHKLFIYFQFYLFIDLFLLSIKKKERKKEKP